MKNVMTMFAFLFVTAFTSVAAAGDGKFPLDKTEEAFFAAPCPGEADLWCVAIRNKNPSESEWMYRLETNGMGEPFGFAKVTKTKIEMVTVSAPKGIRVSRDEITEAYNGESIKYATSRLNWFRSYTTIRMLVATRTGSTIIFSVKNEKANDDGIVYFYIFILVVLFILGFLIARFVHKKSVGFAYALIAIAGAVTSVVILAVTNSWIQSGLPLIVILLGVGLRPIIKYYRKQRD